MHTLFKWIAENPVAAGSVGAVLIGVLTQIVAMFKAVDDRQARVFKERKEAREAAEKAAKETEEKAATAKIIVSSVDEHLLTEAKLKAANVAIITADRDLKIVDWTEAATALFGWPHSMMIGESVEKIIPPSLKDKHRAGVAHYKRTGEQVVIDAGPVALKGLHRDGHEIPVTLNLGKSETVNGTLYFVGAIIPIPPPPASTVEEIEQEKLEQERLEQEGTP